MSEAAASRLRVTCAARMCQFHRPSVLDSVQQQLCPVVARQVIILITVIVIVAVSPLSFSSQSSISLRMMLRRWLLITKLSSLDGSMPWKSSVRSSSSLCRCPGTERASRAVPQRSACL